MGRTFDGGAVVNYRWLANALLNLSSEQRLAPVLVKIRNEKGQCPQFGLVDITTLPCGAIVLAVESIDFCSPDCRESNPSVGVP